MGFELPQAHKKARGRNASSGGLFAIPCDWINDDESISDPMYSNLHQALA